MNAGPGVLVQVVTVACSGAPTGFASCQSSSGGLAVCRDDVVSLEHVWISVKKH